jgi:hypothetical protein
MFTAIKQALYIQQLDLFWVEEIGGINVDISQQYRMQDMCAPMGAVKP